MKKTGLVDLARSPKQMKATNGLVVESTRDKYGYGTCVTLDAEALKKLGIKELPTVGDEYHIVAVGKVVSTAKSATETNDTARVELQLTHLALTHESDAEEASESSAKEKREMYAGKTGMRMK